MLCVVVGRLKIQSERLQRGLGLNLTGKRSACADASTSPRSGGGGGGGVGNTPKWPIQGCAGG